MYKLTFISLVLIFSVGCTDRVKAKLGSIGSSADIICYSGDFVTYQGKSTGKVSYSDSGTMSFVDQNTNALIEISGSSCKVTYENVET
jgi:hypothetical protein